MKIAVIGAGKWGEALHHSLTQKTKTYITSRTKRAMQDFIPLESALESEYLLIAIAAQSTREWLENSFVYKGQKILVASKGIDLATHRFLDDIYKEHIPEENLAFLSGPSFAKEVIDSLPTALVIASKSKETASLWADFFPDFIKIYISDDIKGVEVGGAYKNVIAIASGLCDGLHLGNNARAALITRGLAEITRFGMHFGALEETFLGLSGAGDLFLTASSEMSRNYRVGHALAQHKSLEEILEALGEVAEGVPTTRAIMAICEKEKIYAPIAQEVNAILDGRDPKKSLYRLLERNKEEEF